LEELRQKALVRKAELAEKERKEAKANEVHKKCQRILGGL
jgi:hypothetical protein